MPGGLCNGGTRHRWCMYNRLIRPLLLSPLPLRRRETETAPPLPREPWSGVTVGAGL